MFTNFFSYVIVFLLSANHWHTLTIVSRPSPTYQVESQCLKVMNAKQTGPPYEYEADVCVGSIDFVSVPTTCKFLNLKQKNTINNLGEIFTNLNAFLDMTENEHTFWVLKSKIYYVNVCHQLGFNLKCVMH